MTHTPEHPTSPPLGGFKVKLKKPTDEKTDEKTDDDDLYLGSNADGPGSVMQWLPLKQALEFSSENPDNPSTWRVRNRPEYPDMKALSREPSSPCLPFRVHVRHPVDDTNWSLVTTARGSMLAYNASKGMTLYLSDADWAYQWDRGNLNLVPMGNEAYIEIVP